MKKYLPLILLLAVLLPNTATAANCDRACLKKTLDTYLDAVLKHDPSKAPLDAAFRYTENASVVAPGGGLWKTATALGKVQRRYVDAVNGQAVYFGHIELGNATGIATMRIRVVNKKITEGELVMGQKADGMFNAEALVTNAPPEAPVAKAARSSREAMVAAAQSYFSALDQHDGSHLLAQKGCVRIENGVMTGGPIAESAAFPVRGDCGFNMENFKTIIAAVVHRRYPVVDEEAGVVLGMGILNRPPGAKRGDGTLFPRNLLTEVFVVENGRIRGIYAAMHYLTPQDPDTLGWPVTQ